jgi:hypothetical protein
VSSIQCDGEATIYDPPHGLIETVSPALNSNTYGAQHNNWEAIDWGAISAESFSTINNVGPGMLCGAALERVGTRLLYYTKISILMAKLRLYRKLTDADVNNTIIRRARKRLGFRGFGVIIQECVDLLR